MSEIKERPILFSGAMVRAILSGQKTVTRRPVKRLALQWLDDGFEPSFVADPDNAMCPYGKPGDRLWVRETCRADELISGEDGVRYLADDAWMMIKDDSQSAIDWLKLYNYGKDKGRMVPSIHMPRWVCRILLEITAVRVERLQVITEQQALAEGIDLEGEGVCYAGVAGTASDRPVHSFQLLWELINGAGSWASNPWVWVVEFKRVTP